MEVLQLLGKNLDATGEVIEDYENVVKQLMDYLQKVPQYAKYFKVSLVQRVIPTMMMSLRLQRTGS